jgi:uncharacterized protein YxjI
MPYALELRQRFTPLQNRYDLVGFREGAETVLGYAEQKRFSLKERVTFFGSEDKSAVAFTIGARGVIELMATYDVQTADGSTVAVLSKDAGSSLLRSTYRLDLGAGRVLVARERVPWKAIARRVVGIFTDVPWLFPIQFDVVEGERVVATVDRVLKLRDVYRVEVADDTVDWRAAAATAVAIDAFMNR